MMRSFLFYFLVFILSTVRHVSAWTTYVVPYNQGQDDAPALMAALATLTSSATILFQSGVTYNILTPVKFPVLNNVEISIQGNLSYPTDIATVQNIVSSSSYPGNWFTFTGGNNVTLRGSTDPHSGWVDAHGQAWWDAQQRSNRPNGWGFNRITNGVIKNMKLYKPIGWSFYTSGSSNLHIHNNKIYALSDSSAPSANTDGFSAGGNNLLFENNEVFNGDDCLAVVNGASNIVFRNSYCEGGHGCSIGSLGNGGANVDVRNVLIENVIMKNSTYGARFKSYPQGTGSAQNVTWRNIIVENVITPIFVTQSYPGKGVIQSTTPSSVHISDFLFQNFTGTMNDKGAGNTVTGATGKEVIALNLYPGTVTNMVAKDISVTTNSGAPVAVICNSNTISGDLGFQCKNGNFQRTSAGA